MKSTTMLTIATTTVALAVLGGAAHSTQDKYSLKVPGGLAFSEFRGYEDWAVVAVHHTEDLIKVVVGNPVMMSAYRGGIPGNGKLRPRWRQDREGRVETEKEYQCPLRHKGAGYRV